MPNPYALNSAGSAFGGLPGQGYGGGPPSSFSWGMQPGGGDFWGRPGGTPGMVPGAYGANQGGAFGSPYQQPGPAATPVGPPPGATPPPGQMSMANAYLQMMRGQQGAPRIANPTIGPNQGPTPFNTAAGLFGGAG